MLKLILFISIVSMTSTTFAIDDALLFVPGGEIIQKKFSEVKVKGPKGGIIEIEYTMTGAFDEASGNSVDIDTLVPGDGLMTLDEALRHFRKMGKNPTGDWSLEHSLIHGWFYEFQEFIKGQKVEYKVNAKNGEIITSKIDD